jgi:hypothetical protein
MNTIEKLEKLKLIQLSNLSSLINDIVGYPVNVPEIKLHKSGHISFDSNDLREHTGIMKPYYERFTVSAFSNGFTENDDIYWVSLHFSFTYTSGGSNGTAITNIFYDFKTNTWYKIPGL